MATFTLWDFDMKVCSVALSEPWVGVDSRCRVRRAAVRGPIGSWFGGHERRDGGDEAEWVERGAGRQLVHRLVDAASRTASVSIASATCGATGMSIPFGRTNLSRKESSAARS